MLSVLPESDLIRAITTTLQQLTEKPPYFYEGFSSLVAVWWVMGESNGLNTYVWMERDQRKSIW